MLSRTTRARPRWRRPLALLAAPLLLVPAASGLHAQSSAGTRMERVDTAGASLPTSKPRSSAPPPSRELVERGLKVLSQVRKDLEEFYWDSTFRGFDIDSTYRIADSTIRNAQSVPYVFGAVAQFVAELRDSHTNFAPPNQVAQIDYGFRPMFIGDTCYIRRVVKGSDAAAKGLTRGDAILQWDLFRVERKSFHTLDYVYNTLSPRPVIRLVVRHPAGEHETLEVKAKITQGERVIDPNDASQMQRLWDDYERQSRVANHSYRTVSDSVMVWRMRHFAYADDDNIKSIMKEVRKHKALVLDLRDNPGGLITTQVLMTGQFLDHDVEIYTERTRKGVVKMVAQGQKDPWRGMLVILINSGSASASELTSRALQYMGRAIIVGDQSMGAVVAARFFQHEVGFQRVLNYGTQVTVSDIKMADGNRLENVGVIPDLLVLPTPQDILAGRDPQMAKALELVGVKITPEEAGRIYRGSEGR